jgi:hypothetical protein
VGVGGRQKGAGGRGRGRRGRCVRGCGAQGVRGRCVCQERVGARLLALQHQHSGVCCRVILSPSCPQACMHEQLLLPLVVATAPAALSWHFRSSSCCCCRRRPPVGRGRS